MSLNLKNIYSSLPNTERGQPVKLGGDPKGKNFVYASGSSIIIRDIENPFITDVYNEHAKKTFVAKYSPSGFYIASGDASGKVRIWDTQTKEHILKFELQCFAGEIRDICWTGDSKRIIAVGSGKGTFAKAFMWDSGSNVGTIDKHEKDILAVDCRLERPYRAATGGLDFSVNFYTGVPYKFEKKHKIHTRFVNDIRFSPDGSLFATVGSDKGIHLFEGESGNLKSSFPVEHAGGVYGVSWSADGKNFMTCSGDKTVKIWDVETQKSISTHTMGNDTEDQQVGCLWQGNHLLSVSLNGKINYVDRNNNDKPLRVIHGHNKAITSVVYDNNEKNFYTGSFDAVLTKWNETDGSNDCFVGSGHTNQIQSMFIQNGNLVTGSMDGTVRVTPLATREYSAQFKCEKDVTGVVVGTKNNSLIVATSLDGISVIQSGIEVSKQVTKTTTSYEPTCVSLSADEKHIAVGGKDKNVHIYSIEGNAIKEVKTFPHEQALTCLQYSPDGKHLASCAKGEIFVWDLEKGEKCLYSNGWGSYHQAEVRAVRWAPDSSHLATCSNDESIRIWDINSRNKIVLTGAHKAGTYDVVWISENVIASVGADSNLKTWDVKF